RRAPPGDGADLRWGKDELRRARRPRPAARGGAAAAGCHPRGRGRRLSGAVPRLGGGAARRVAGRCRLPAADPEYPDERLAFMITDAGSRVVLTSARLALRPWPEISLVLADDPADTGHGDPGHGGPGHADAAWPAAEPVQPAYVIYTSGS